MGIEGGRVEIAISRAANRFHVVDQLSEWSPYCHRQYGRHFYPEGKPDSEGDRSLLSEHAKIRQAHGFGSGFEGAFYEFPTIDGALAACVARGDATKEEAAAERRILEAFAPRVDALFDEQYPWLSRFAAEVERRRPELERFLATASRFTGAKLESAQFVYLIGNPSARDFGGGADGGRIKLEVPRDRDLFPTFFHELFHVFLNRRRDAMERALAAEKTLDLETLGEGFAYAVGSGIYGTASDYANLEREAGADLRAGKLLDEPYVRFRRYAVALCPLLRGALETQTLDVFLPRAIDTWRSVRALSLAANANDREAWFCFGPGWQTVFEIGKTRRVDLYSRNHALDQYDAMFAKARSGSRVVLLFARDSQDSELPPQYQDLLPCPWSEFLTKWKAKGSLELTSGARGMRVGIFAAPTTVELARLVSASAFFKD